ncbi:flagellin N-terminal helical domain-containing protein [Niallia sp. HCP3S3_B10]|uniref:flagellin N-terminal helical domain-containing protein n=1 Tax=Niallia sp. HCP3S3_B10 TaxID=3438944 RepID=UPI003F8C3B99
MEKLSSGLRINRAGDDAAGLAISEKMRGQIRGLDQASKNSQDAISMIQTAEGALNETHDILQRMKELSTQAANGTNTDDDRAEIQKEVNQLTSEINRIGNTTEFNTKKLLQGSTSKSDVGATAKAGTAAVDAVNATKAEWTTGNIDAMAATESGTFEFMGVTINITAATTADTSDATATSNVTATSADLLLDTDSTNPSDGADTAAEQAAAIVGALNAIKAESGSPLADFTFASDSSGNITITDSAAAGSTNNAAKIVTTGDLQVSSTNLDKAATTPGVDAVAGVKQSYDLTFDKAPTEGSTINVAGKDVAFYDSSKGTYSDATDAQTKLGSDFVIDVNGKNTSDIAAAVAALDFTNSGTGATAEAVGNKVTFTAETAGKAAADNAKVTTSDAYAGTKSVLNATTATDDDASGDTFEMSVVVGDKTFTVDASLLKQNFTALDTYGSSQQTDVINALKNATATDGTKLSELVNVSFENGANQTLKLEAKEVGTDNIKTVLTGTTTNIAGALGLTAGTQTGTAGTDAFENSGKDFVETFQVGANQGQSFSIAIKDMRSNALGLTGDSAGATSKDVPGAKYTTTKDVTNGTDNTAVEFALDVSSTESASAAIKVLDNAIQSVSAERSKLGASQNRLEHTINNLNTSSENLTAAESRIRDVDMAKEMMNQTKNSILSQAAQAMLAQSNQMPQGVLQLLR